jgi:hypothetical protein
VDKNKVEDKDGLTEESTGKATGVVQ